MGGQRGWLEGVELEQLADEGYFLRMRACGTRSRQWDDRYIGLLAGAVDRGLPRLRGFRDIFHMAALQARMSRKKVREVLRIARAIRPCPGLWRLFTRGEVSWTKVRAVASLAREDWDADLCARVKRHTRRDLELWVRRRVHQLEGNRSDAGAPLDPDPPSFGTSRTGSVDPVDPAVVEPPAQREADGGDGSTRALEEGASSNGPLESATEADGEPGSAGAPSSQNSPPRRTPSEHETAGAAEGALRTRVAGPDTVMHALVALGVDPLAVEKLSIDRNALSGQRDRPSLVWVLEQAILAYRPSGRAVKLPYLSVIHRCPECGRGSMASASGPLPIDWADEALLGLSGAPVDLERELAQRGVPVPEPPEFPSPSSIATDNATIDLVNQSRGEARRPPVPARDVRVLIAVQRGRCAARGCQQPVAELHHLEPFDPARGHDVRTMHLICRDHHRLVHTDWIENPADRPWDWRLRVTPASRETVDDRRGAVDRAFGEFVRAVTRRDEELANELAVEEEVTAPAVRNERDDDWVSPGGA